LQPRLPGARVLFGLRRLFGNSSGKLTQLMNAWLAGSGLLSDVSVHGLRKLAAASHAGAECAKQEIAAITGHKSLAMHQVSQSAAAGESGECSLGRRTENAVKSSDKFLKKNVISC
jgi:integrase